MAEQPVLTVAIESVVHDAIRGVVQRIMDQHGVIVKRIDVSWFDVSVYGCQPRQCIDDIRIDSHKTFADIPPPR